jgi:hypothetical protein
LLGACASAPPSSPERCFVGDEAVARQIAALVSGMSPGDGSLQVSDAGDHWRVGRYAETWLEGNMIMSRDAGFTFVIDKCSGAMSGYRAWG